MNIEKSTEKEISPNLPTPLITTVNIWHTSSPSCLSCCACVYFLCIFTFMYILYRIDIIVYIIHNLSYYIGSIYSCH